MTTPNPESGSDNDLNKREAPKKLSSEPGWMAEFSSRLIGLTMRESNNSPDKSKKYDPYSFMEKMALPFGPMPNKDGKDKKGGDLSQAGGAIIDPGAPKKRMPHCKACTDFKTWMELTAHPRRDMSRQEREEKECPLDSELLGRNTWAFLHTMAAYYPEKPSPEQQHNMRSFITLLSQFYPCHTCAAHLREDLKTNVPDTGSNMRLSQWFCKLHNKVNVRLGKPEFDCKKVLERWRDGWADGTCD